MNNQYSQMPDFGLSNNLVDTAPVENYFNDVVNNAKDLVKKGDDVASAINKATEKVTSNEDDGIGTKVKRKFNEASPMVVGGVTGLLSKFAFKLGWLTSGVIAVVSYIGKTHLDKEGGLSDSFEWSVMAYDSKSKDGKELYKNTRNGRLYYIGGIDQNGLVIWKQYY
jgi:hypothetical protein